MTFLDDSTLLFGEPSAVRLALDAAMGRLPTLTPTPTWQTMMSSVDSSPRMEHSRSGGHAELVHQLWAMLRR